MVPRSWSTANPDASPSTQDRGFRVNDQPGLRPGNTTTLCDGAGEGMAAILDCRLSIGDWAQLRTGTMVILDFRLTIVDWTRPRTGTLAILDSRLTIGDWAGLYTNTARRHRGGLRGYLLVA